MNDATVLAALLRSDLRFFVWKSFQTILPGTAYLPNWHVDAIVHQLIDLKGKPSKFSRNSRNTTIAVDVR
jgi:hypothetical protein